MQRKSLSYLNQWNNQKKRKPLIIRGARQVGKSTLVRQFAKQAKLKLIEINFEKLRQFNDVFTTLDAAKIIATIESDRKEKINPNNSLLFFDEIQTCPQAIVSLRYFYEDLPQYKVIAAGSLLEFALSEDKLSIPVGRITYHYLSPLTFDEFLIATNETFLVDHLINFNFEMEWPETLHKHFLESLRKYLVIGGMPEAVQAYIDGESTKHIRSIQQNLIALYADDFSKYATKTELAKLQIIYQRLPQFIGKKIKYSELIPGERSNTISILLHLLEKAGIIHLVQHADCNGIPVDAHADPRIIKAYWLDCGLLNQMHGLSWDEISMSNDDQLVTDGIVAEQFVAQELLAHFDSPIKPKLHYWLREGKKGNAEVDFVIQKLSKIIPIEVKSGKIGKMKSLLYMIGLKKFKSAILISNQLPSREIVQHKVAIDQNVIDAKFELSQYPLYLASTILKPT